MIKKYGKSLTIALAILCFLFFSQIQVHAQGTQTKKLPGVPLLLLSETPSPQPKPNIAFVTSVTYNGNLGGLAGADQKCQSLATAAGLPANTYKAWISTSTVNAIDRLGAARGWVRVDGKAFADTKADIAAGKIFHPLRVDEKGVFDNQAGGASVWTGTNANGTVYLQTCVDWTSSSDLVNSEVGHDDGVTTTFTAYGTAAGCSIPYRLYCFGVGNNAPVTVTPVAGRIAFITNAPWIPSTGLAAADGLCQSEAVSAALTGNFKALLAQFGASAASRFNSSGLPWVRPDGVAIAPTAAELFSADFLNTAINQSADGQYWGNYSVWTGASDPAAIGTMLTTCNNWASAGDADVATCGTASLTSQENFFGQYSPICSATYIRLYCLQD